jgi:hypothetical protein
MSPEEVSGIMDGPGITSVNSQVCIGPGFSISWEIFEVGNGWMADVSFLDLKLRKKALYFPRNPPLYGRAWQFLQDRIPSLPNLPF